MSINIDPDKMRASLSYEEGLYNKALERLNYSQYIKERVLFTISGLARNVGKMYLALGDYQKARDYFLTSFKYKEEWINLDEKYSDPTINGGGFYTNFYDYLKGAILTLSNDLIEKAANRFDLSIPVNEWDRPSRPYYAVDLALANLILDKKDELKKIKVQSEDIRRDAAADGILAAIWAIEENNLENLKLAFKTIIASESHNNEAKFASVSPIATALLVIAKMKGMELEDFDPPMVDMNYIRLSDSL